MNPDLLISRILKARYFPKGDFLSAKSGYNPSYSWRSLLEARFIIKAGSRWRVGYGSNIRVWKDPWLPRPTTFLPITPQSLFLPDLWVSDLLDKDNRCWNSELIEGIFCLEDSNLIKSIPVSNLAIPDFRVWHFNKKGEFSVKSASHIPLSSLMGKKEALPTTSNLNRRQCRVEPHCSTCGWESETVKHVLLDCNFARQAWALSHLPWKVICSWSQGALEWIAEVRKSLDHDQFNSFVIICWQLWGRRNRFVMENTLSSPLDCVRAADLLLHDFHNVVATRPSSLPKELHWQAPIEGAVKINFDAAISNKGCGIGLITRDWKGQCIGWCSNLYPDVQDPEHGEALAARSAVELCCKIHGSYALLKGIALL
ncbi:UNVERIFIED_CONTAM: hypothetical protein Slati_4498600 [Sesamum latifolium]|uniref:Reverse transcriptase zinc-binding domain-containing protein n=1 Tax=Sesamum latifolium TaxID=2727402 RepID=A0AAW2SSD0_9LAMI